MPSNHLVITTRLEEPKLFLVQGKEVEAIYSSLKFLPFCREKIGWIYTLSPNPTQLCPELGVQLNREAHSNTRSAFEIYLSEALYYAQINGHAQESLVLAQGLKIMMEAYKTAKAKEAVVAGPPKGDVEPNPFTP